MSLYSRAFNQMLRNDPFSPVFSRSSALSPFWNPWYIRSPWFDDDQPEQQRIQQSPNNTNKEIAVSGNSGDKQMTQHHRHRRNADRSLARQHQQPLSVFSPFLNTPSMPEMAVDFFTTPTAYNVHASLPGINKSDIKITVDEGMLNIQAERKHEIKQKKNSDNTKGAVQEKQEMKEHPSTESKYDSEGDQEMGQYDYIESTYGRVERSFPLPDDVDVNSLSAKYEDGVIKINIPRVAQKKSETKTIQIQ